MKSQAALVSRNCRLQEWAQMVHECKNRPDQKHQLLLEQVAVLNNHRFGKSSEKLETENQISFLEVDGNIIYFNEAEAVESQGEYEEDDETVKPRGKKSKGKRAADIQNLPIIPVEHKMTEEELITEFGEDGWYQLEDEIYNRYRFTPMKVEIEEHHVGVYKSKKDNHFKRANHPTYLLRNSLVSPTLLAGIWNVKYVNAEPLYRQEQEFQHRNSKEYLRGFTELIRVDQRPPEERGWVWQL